MHKGKHLLIDCQNVGREVCLDDRTFLGAMARAAELAGAQVVSQVRYKFGHDSPPGFAAVVMLDESHCSAHSYADLGLVAMDVFTCGHTNPRDVLRYLREEIDLGDVSICEMSRFEVADETCSEGVKAGHAEVSSDATIVWPVLMNAVSEELVRG